MREWVTWLVDGGPKNAPCCRHATDEEIREQPDLFDCTTCGAARLDKLWPENAEAWGCYQALCGRTVRTFELHEWVLDQTTADMRPRDRRDLLDRLDLILEMTRPESTPDGSDSA